MKSIYSVTGMTCGKCATKVEQAISGVAGVLAVQVNLKNKKVEIISNAPIDLSVLNNLLSQVGTYTLSATKKTSLLRNMEIKVRLFFPLVIIFTVILSWTAIHQEIQGFTLYSAMHDFMAGFFIIFGGLKIINWKNFTIAFSAYDPLAKRIKIYAYVYPAIEIFLGLAYQFRFIDELPVNVITIIILTISTIGVVKKLHQKEVVQCACLGGFFNIPISWFTVFENALMIAMAIYMQVVFGKI